VAFLIILCQKAVAPPIMAYLGIAPLGLIAWFSFKSVSFDSIKVSDDHRLLLCGSAVAAPGLYPFIIWQMVVPDNLYFMIAGAFAWMALGGMLAGFLKINAYIFSVAENESWERLSLWLSQSVWYLLVVPLLVATLFVLYYQKIRQSTVGLYDLLGHMTFLQVVALILCTGIAATFLKAAQALVKEWPEPFEVESEEGKT
jgi:hypothetical protein